MNLNLPVRLSIGNKEISCIGLVDTGNSLFDPLTGKPVIILERSVMEKHNITIPIKGFRVIPFRSIGKQNGVLKGFIADRIQITQEEETREIPGVVVGIYEGRLNMNDEYQMILHPKL